MGKRFDYEYMIIGGGTSGTIAAKQLASAGRKVALVEQDSWANSGYAKELPRKALFHFSHLLKKC